MRSLDVAVIGGGLAGSMAAAMLGRAGIKTALIDPNPVPRPDFRVEKFDATQLALLARTGLAEAGRGAVARAATLWIARYGRLLDKRPGDQWSFRYEDVVTAMRAAAGGAAEYIAQKAVRIETGAERQRVELADGRVLAPRLVVLANGLNVGLKSVLGIERQVLSPAHSVSVGFDLAPAGRDAFAFPSLTYYPERLSDRMAYCALFPLRDTMRANLFFYRDPGDPWLTELRRAPEATLHALLPRLAALTGRFEATSRVIARPVDLYVATGHRQGGVVLVGDAYSTSCPAAGTGANKALTDVARLAAHVPAWLTTPGMGPEKIAAFYDDPEKVACEAFCLDKAFRLRSLTLEPGPAWRARRLARFLAHGGRGLVRQMRGRPQSSVDAPASLAPQS